jgi:hypothetical protein
MHAAQRTSDARNLPQEGVCMHAMAPKSLRNNGDLLLIEPVLWRVLGQHFSAGSFAEQAQVAAEGRHADDMDGEKKPERRSVDGAGQRPALPQVPQETQTIGLHPAEQSLKLAGDFRRSPVVELTADSSRPLIEGPSLPVMHGDGVVRSRETSYVAGRDGVVVPRRPVAHLFPRLSAATAAGRRGVPATGSRARRGGWRRHRGRRAWRGCS